MTTVTWDKSKFKRFKKVFQQYLVNGELLPNEKDSVFEFEGNDFVVGYAKYLIEYLEPKFKGV